MSHTLFIAEARADDRTLTVAGDEARHAIRSKRVAVGESVRVLNGAGLELACRVADARRELVLEVESASVAARVTPAVHVMSATPKGPRLDKMIDQLSQIGAASWTPLETEWGVVDPGDRKLDRVRRIAVESAKQCARAWLLEIHESIPLSSAWSPGTDIVVADAAGAEYSPRGSGEIRLLVGPEGGFSPRELEAARAAGARLARFGPHVMRIETAAAAACAVVLHAEGGR